MPVQSDLTLLVNICNFRNLTFILAGFVTGVLGDCLNAQGYHQGCHSLHKSTV